MDGVIVLTDIKAWFKALTLLTDAVVVGFNMSLPTLRVFTK